MIPLRDDNPSELKPVVVIAFIATCTLVYLWQFAQGAQGGATVLYSLGLIPSVLFGINQLPADLATVPPTLTVLTSMFMHGGWLHLIGNMLYLWIFGDNVEDRFGHAKFVVFYLVCGIAATFAQLAFSADSAVPNLGASGAVAGVLGAYLLLYPRGRVHVMMGRGVVPAPALMVIGLWFALQLFSGIGSVASNVDDGGGVAYMAHVGGFVAGFLLTFLLRGKPV